MQVRERHSEAGNPFLQLIWQGILSLFNEKLCPLARKKPILASMLLNPEICPEMPQSALNIELLPLKAGSPARWLTGLNVPVVHRLANSIQSDAGRDAALAKQSRRLEFELGRMCADAALLDLGYELPKQSGHCVGVSADRSPIWPPGIVGSISHSEQLTWAAVANRNQVRSLGVDTEICMTTKAMNQVRSEVASRHEWDSVDEAAPSIAEGLSRELTTTLVFSAKEAFYKCWFPLAKQFFEFADVSVSSLDASCLRLQPNPSCPVFEMSPSSLDVHFSLQDSNVFTFTWMPHE